MMNVVMTALEVKGRMAVDSSKCNSVLKCGAYNGLYDCLSTCLCSSMYEEESRA